METPPPRKSWLVGLTGASSPVDAAREIRAAVGKLSAAWSAADSRSSGAKAAEARPRGGSAADMGNAVRAKRSPVGAAKAPMLLARALEPTTPSFGGCREASPQPHRGRPGCRRNGQRWWRPHVCGSGLHSSSSSSSSNDQARAARCPAGRRTPWRPRRPRPPRAPARRSCQCPGCWATLRTPHRGQGMSHRRRKRPKRSLAIPGKMRYGLWQTPKSRGRPEHRTAQKSCIAWD
mmetsp:Transcript_60903/g.188573  ORF Transcript_60903/g.188573 Transcript_60903/m.188573 type:complete len:234 (-) Transcript_60903:29-730(-)